MSEPMRAIGFFRELEHGKKDGPSIVEAKGRLPVSLRETVATYLRAGRSIAIRGTGARDGLDPDDATPKLELKIQTDGRWVWPSDLAYYVQKHGVAVPQAFIDEAQACDWRVPDLPKEERHRILDAMRRKDAIYL